MKKKLDRQQGVPGSGDQPDSQPKGQDEAAAAPAPAPAPEQGGTAEEGKGSGEADTQEAVRRLTREQEALKDQYLRLAADFDNFRKRAARERSETWARAQAVVVSNLLDALDDLERVSAVDAGQTKAEDVLVGVRLVERKILKELENVGLKRVGSEGEVFDPNHHEAVAALPAPSSDHHDQVAAVLQPGYQFSGALLRPAKVQVFVEPDEQTE